MSTKSPPDVSSLSTIFTSSSHTPMLPANGVNSTSDPLIQNIIKPTEVSLILGFTLALLVVILGIGSKASHASDVLVGADMCTLRKIYQVTSLFGNACAVGVLLCGRHSMEEVLNVAPWLIARVIAAAIDFGLITQIIIVQKCQTTSDNCHNDKNPPRYSPLQQDSSSSDSDLDWLPDELKRNKYLNRMREMSRHYIPMNSEVKDSSSEDQDEIRKNTVAIELRELQPREAANVITASQDTAMSLNRRGYNQTDSDLSSVSSSIVDSELETELPHWSGADEEVALDEDELSDSNIGGRGRKTPKHLLKTKSLNIFKESSVFLLDSASIQPTQVP